MIDISNMNVRQQKIATSMLEDLVDHCEITMANITVALDADDNTTYTPRDLEEAIEGYARAVTALNEACEVSRKRQDEDFRAQAKVHQDLNLH